MRDKIQNFGRALSAMVMPNIGAFIAWGLITALFIPTGWFPNEHLAKLVSPMLTYMLPLLIGYTAGHNVAGVRGGVIGAIATAGVIVGTNVPMFIGAMIMGPFAAWVIKKFDKAVEGKVRAGFEMLVNNFSLGIIGMLLAIVGYLTIGGAISWITELFESGIVYLKDHNMLPLVSIFIEPAKVMFLNNAINHGILTPLGTVQVKEFGESIIFFLESNPGPGFGMLMAYWIFGKGAAKSSAPGAVLIQFVGGIHEIYYPYVLSRPLLIIPMILGASSSILFLTIVGAGLVGPISPGSIISVILMAPKGKTLLLVSAVLIAAIVTFVTSALIIRRTAKEDDTLPENRFKPKYKRDAQSATDVAKARHIVFACDAGMGSSALGATRFRKRIEPLALDLKVTNSSVNSIPADADVVVCQQGLVSRAKGNAPKVRVVAINNFLDDPALDSLYEELSKRSDKAAEAEDDVVTGGANPSVLQLSNIKVGAKATDKWEAIAEAGNLLVKGGYVKMEYVDAMMERERITTTYLGMGIAIPHGTESAKKQVLRTGISVVQYPEGVDFDGEKAYLVIGIAGVGDEHLELLARVSEALEDEQVLEKLKTTTDSEDIYKVLNA
ncbi:MAG: PTS mannitol transporter subunit IICBA [Alistipes sp.]|nr:PTS mannitol transporter subunit IICBA [Rikenellaceae bacterium]MBP3497413.1 PTS mannitol transporter subunit IICBA [Alistipes sp.]